MQQMDYGRFRLHQLVEVSKPAWLTNLAVHFAAFLRQLLTSYMAGKQLSQSMPELANVFVHLSFIFPPVIAAHYGHLNRLLPACLILTHVARSLAGFCVGIGLAPVVDGMRTPLSLHIELAMDVIFSYQHQVSFSSV